ncbi:unnamed protein product [Oikopleura dioica]|uniref:Uncharacterized protein n=1 Tax=Oikopleura dioica TaxID=34765 RepID=E4YC21_OIKDI|nr:unnamed protein product [Oikopleura dioica]
MDLESSVIAYHRQGRRGEQLRPWPLHHRQGDHRPRSRPHSQAIGQLHRSSGVHGVPLLRWRHRQRLHLAAHGASFC